MPKNSSSYADLNGPLYMLLSCVVFSILGGLIRHLAMMDFHPFMTAFIRTLIAIIVLIPTFYKVGISGLKSDKKPLHLLRGVASGSAAIAGFYAISVIPMANAVSYSFIAPLLTTILAIIFLKERIHLPRILSIIVGFIGVIILLRPGSVPFSTGVGAALYSAFAVAIAFVCIRSLSHTEKANVIAIYSLLITLPFSFVFALFQWSWPSLEQWVILIFIGIGAAIGQFSLSKAFSHSETTAILPIDFTRLLFAATIGYVFFNETPDYYTFIGAMIILSSAIYTAHREAKYKNKYN